MFMFNDFACLASFFPMFPNPTIPRYFPLSSLPINSFLIQFPLRTSLSARGISLAIDNIRPITSSATAFIAPSTALITLMFFSFAAFSSILSRPTPTLAIILHLSAFSISSLTNLVLLRTTTTWKFPIFSANCSGVISGS